MYIRNRTERIFIVHVLLSFSAHQISRLPCSGIHGLSMRSTLSTSHVCLVSFEWGLRNKASSARYILKSILLFTLSCVYEYRSALYYNVRRVKTTGEKTGGREINRKTSEAQIVSLVARGALEPRDTSGGIVYFSYKKISSTSSVSKFVLWTVERRCRTFPKYSWLCCTNDAR